MPSPSHPMILTACEREREPFLFGVVVLPNFRGSLSIGLVY